MSDDTDHPTQKPKKLVAKLVLASSNLGDVMFYPFSEAGILVVVAKKLNRRFPGAELNLEYCC